MSAKLKDLSGQLGERRDKLARIFDEAGSDFDMEKVTSLEGDNAGKVDQIRSLNAEIDDLAKQVEDLKASEGDAVEFASMASKLEGLGEVAHPAIHPTGQGGRGIVEPRKSIGELFVESQAYTGRTDGLNSPMSRLDVGLADILATTMTTSAGWAPESVRTGRVVDEALRPLQLTDLVPRATTTQAAVVYMEETTVTNNAAERAEAAAYAESALALTQRSTTIRSFGTSLPITDEQLADVAQAMSYVDGRLGFLVAQRLDGQLLNGDGTGANITGYLNHADLQTQAKGADSVPDAIYKAMTLVRVTGRAMPSGVVIHPNDWQAIRLLTTADGIYIWGSPSEAGPERIWGMPVVQCDAIAENTGLVGDFSPVMSQLYIRQGLDVQVGYVNDDFLDGRKTVRAGLRAGLVIYRGAAFCSVTGI